MKRSIFSICMLLITAVIVSPGQSKELDGIVGQSVTFTAPVKNKGSLRYENGVIGGVIGDVTNGKFTRFAKEKSRDRLQWDGSTGLFSLSGLEIEDSGKYEVWDTKVDIKTVFKLNMYIPVSKPDVSVTHDKYPCKLMCTVERGTGVTLSWYREGEEESYIHTHPLSAPDLKLPVPLDKGGIYTCEAKNSVSTNTSDPITVEPHCTAPSASSTGMIVGIVIGFLVFAIIGFVAGVCYSKKCPNATSAGQPNGKGPEVQPDGMSQTSNTEQAPLNAANGNGTN